MYDCSKDVTAYHNTEVTLSQDQQKKMREHRDSNRSRLTSRLGGDSTKPSPKEFIKQGSYAMRTMVQEPSNDYDIDDGVYFTQLSLKGPNGGDKSARDARQMVCDALQDTRFNTQPDVRKNCVRIYYNEGYHVDMPVYRIRDEDGDYELASGSDWIHSRAADVEEWFQKANTDKSPDTNNGRQFRRIVRMLKKFARSRLSWKNLITSGFAITVLAEEQYVAAADRDDVALRNIMRGMYNRLLLNLEVKHPVTSGAMVTKGPDDAKMKFFRDKLGEALENLNVLDQVDCTQEQALKAWDKVFSTSFFSDRCQKSETAGQALGNSAVLTNMLSSKKDPPPVHKDGGGRFA